MANRTAGRALLPRSQRRERLADALSLLLVRASIATAKAALCEEFAKPLDVLGLFSLWLPQPPRRPVSYFARGSGIGVS